MNLATQSLLLGCILSFLSFFSQGCSNTQRLQQENNQMRAEATYQPTTPADSSYKIKTGDEIEILVWEQPKFNTKTTVSSIGTIAIPLIGEVQASGLTHSEFKQELTRELSRYIKDEINLTVSISNTDNLRVSVFGMVARPDNYPIVNKTSIFKILSMAGGPSEEANMQRVRIYRSNSNPHYTTLDLTQYLESGKLSDDVAQVYPGDVVYVPRKENMVREMSGFLRDVVLLFAIFRVVN
jgi:polysaccharide export outer membrane protein